MGNYLVISNILYQEVTNSDMDRQVLPLSALRLLLIQNLIALAAILVSS